MPQIPNYVDLEIRIYKKEANGYPVEMTLNHEQQYSGGYLDPGGLPWLASASPEKDGQRLYDWLFTDRKLAEDWARIRGQSPQLRLRLRITTSAPELHQIPWELLRDGSGAVAQQLAALEATPFSRYLTGEMRPGSPILKRPIKMLVAVAAPEDLGTWGFDPEKDQIKPDEEWDLLQQATAEIDSLAVELLPQPCTLPAIEAKLIEGFHILHLIGHGVFIEDGDNSEALLYLAKAETDNRVEPVNQQKFAEMLARQLADVDTNRDDKLRLVFLSSCQTASRSPADAFRGLAPALVAAGVPAVVAMQDNVPVDTARAFAQTFYRQLLRHGLVDLAGNEARAATITADLPGTAIPVVFSRLQENQLFDFSGVEFKPRPRYEPETVLIPAGKFWMGCEPDEAGSRDYEAPRHQVDLPAFRIGRYPVTNEQYWQFVKATSRRAPRIGWQGQRPVDDKLNHPVMGVTWYDAVNYCEWLSEKTARTYRLPSEAEWEKAARGPDSLGPYPWGVWAEERCNYQNSVVAPVDHFPSQSDYGCFDLVGNVGEWTRSLYGKSISPDPDFYYPWDSNPDRDDETADKTIYRAYRGGFFNDTRVTRLRCGARRGLAPDKPGESNQHIGFRVVLEIRT